MSAVAVGSESAAVSAKKSATAVLLALVVACDSMVRSLAAVMVAAPTPIVAVALEVTSAPMRVKPKGALAWTGWASCDSGRTAELVDPGYGVLERWSGLYRYSC